MSHDSHEEGGRVKQNTERITDLTKYLAIKSDQTKSVVLKQDEKQEQDTVRYCFCKEA